ncbi:MAG: type IV secretory system conjugative DNA transfer family protein [Hyphomicrobiaceae bacterium]
MKTYYDGKYDDAPSTGKYLVDALLAFGSPAAAMASAAVAFNVKRWKHVKKRYVEQLFPRLVVERPFLTLKERDKAVFRAVAQLLAMGAYTHDQWVRFVCLFVWGNGQGVVKPVPVLADHPRAVEAVREAQELVKHLLPSGEAFMADAARDVAVHLAGVGVVSGVPVGGQGLHDGARWMTAEDLAQSRTYASKRTPPALFIGSLPGTNTHVFYPGHESLITIAGPGAGKSSALVIPNLLTYPGSVVVLDVKGDLWQKTAGHRKSAFGPVYRFAPTDPTGNSHCFNPFDFISSDAAVAANDCEVFSQQVILDRAQDKDPYWEGKGRDFLWAFAMLLALAAPKGERTMEGLGEMLSLSTALRDPDDRSSGHPDTMGIIKALESLADQYAIPDLQQAATTFRDGLDSNRLDSVFDAARRHLSVFGRSSLVRRALATSDWHPLDLRLRPGTSLYICVDEPKAYGAIIRLMVYQHFRLLKDHAARADEPPVTFFLDEMPRLGNFTSLLDMQDVGRSAGLRLWMFAQSYGQLVQHYGAARAPGIVDACRVRTFLQPQADEVKFILPALGEVRNVFTGEKTPLATKDQLMGHVFGDKMVVTTRGDRPLVLAPKFAHQSRSLSEAVKAPPNVK